MIFVCIKILIKFFAKPQQLKVNKYQVYITVNYISFF